MVRRDDISGVALDFRFLKKYKNKTSENTLKKRKEIWGNQETSILFGLIMASYHMLSEVIFLNSVVCVCVCV